MKTSRAPISSRDYDGIILDMLDDIVAAENRAKRLIDRLDVISKHPKFRVINIDAYLWAIATIAVAAFLVGAFVGFAIHFWLKGG